ncbi:HEPN/Toprim-associated domain-containing protein (plasmid) [Pseudomonas nitroreducens]|uniref:HEPN/Toprim-associated domain-containing protein n=1 Tax=Pseudomonadaceae TaxID=135621 RepID=UPI0002F50AED|nr:MULTISPECIES: HEPN/Toprim-associated domain-containing protein [Pseudomonadaceae]
MSTPITLTVGDIELTYNTTYMGVDHGMLFQESDRQRRRHRNISYEYYEQHPDEDVSQCEICFCRSLRSLVPRLELLGYTLTAVETEYDRLVLLEHETDDPEGISTSALLDFDQFVAFIRTYSVSSLSDEYNPNYDEEHGEKRGLFSNEPAIEQLPAGALYRDTGGYSERSHFGNLLGFLSPYSTLRVLAENPENLDLEVVWDYGNFVSAGWAQNNDFVAGARRTQTYLIATEGSSDTYILKRAITLLLPEVQDFFRFMEVADRHPFSGTGNLAKFAEGLVKIDVHNRVVFLFDNDAEGYDAFRSLQRFNFPVNMCAMVLPDLEELRSFPARGPGGVSNADINGRAAAIECYLDLRLKGRKLPQVTWTNYKDKLDIYQGSLDFKESYADAFYEASAEAISTNEYDVSKLRIVLNALLRQCSQMAEQMHPFVQHSE